MKTRYVLLLIVSAAAFRHGLAAVQWPARFQRLGHLAHQIDMAGVIVDARLAIGVGEGDQRLVDQAGEGLPVGNDFLSGGLWAQFRQDDMVSGVPANAHAADQTS